MLSLNSPFEQFEPEKRKVRKLGMFDQNYGLTPF